MRYKKVSEFLGENAMFLDKKCKNCTGSLEPKDFSAGGCTRYECTMCGTSYTPDGKKTVTARRVKAANESASENNNKVDSFKKELKELLAKYNAEIYADSEGDGFSSAVVIDIDDNEILRITTSIRQEDIN